MRIFCLPFVAVALLEGATTALAQQSCIANSLPGNKNFCLTKYGKNVPMTEGACTAALGPMHGSHVVLKCTAGVYKDRDWDLWCWGDGTGKCNITQYALCTYTTAAMRNAEEKNAGETCTNP
jgi:hypothetical protein